MAFDKNLPGTIHIKPAITPSAIQPSAAMAVILVLLLWGLHAQVMAEVPVARQAALRHLLKQDCGSCHGMTLKGGLGPPLTTNEIAEKPKQLLSATILDGRPGTPMPPFRGLLTEEEVNWLVELLYRGDS